MKAIEYTPGMTITPPCLVLNMPNDVYHAWPDSVSKSGLDLVLRSPAHYQYSARRPSTRAMEIGTAIHTALLEPERFQEDYVLLRDVKDRRASEYKQAVKQHGSEVVLVSSEADNVAGMQESVRSRPFVRDLLSAPGHREASLFVQDPETGTLVRCRYDLITDDGHAVDVKKTQDVRPAEFSKSVYNYGYHRQAAFYSDAWEWATGERIVFEFLAVEEQLPHAAKLYELDHTAIEIGRAEYRAALNSYAQCSESGLWPAHECEGAELITLPGWVIAQYENDITEEIV